MDVSHGSKELDEIVMPSRSWTHLNWLILPRLHYAFGVAFCIRSSPEQIETNRIIIHSTFNMDIKCDIRSRSLPRRGRTNAISIAFLPFSNAERVELIRLAWPPTERGAKEHRRCRSPYDVHHKLTQIENNTLPATIRLPSHLLRQIRTPRRKK